MTSFIDKHRKVLLLILLLIVMVIVFSIWSVAVGNNFFQSTTLKNILNSLVVSSFLALGAGCLMISGNIDLSQASVGALGSMVFAMTIKTMELPWWLGVIVALAISALFGLINGVLINEFKFPAFIATLAIASVTRGLMYFTSSFSTEGGSANTVAFTNDATSYLGRGEPIPGVPLGVIIMVLFFIVYGVLMSKTKFGLKVTFVGGNPEAARLTGINPKRISYLLFINSAVLGGVAGIFNASRIGQGSLTALQTNQFTGMTAAILGGISFGGGAGGMGGAFVGLLILNTFQIGMTTVGVNSFWVSVFTGLLMLVALSIDFFNRKRVMPVVVAASTDGDGGDSSGGDAEVHDSGGDSNDDNGEEVV